LTSRSSIYLLSISSGLTPTGPLRRWRRNGGTADTCPDARQGTDFRCIIEPKIGDAIYDLAKFLDAFDIRATYPLLMAMLDTGLSDRQWSDVSKTLQSYVVRRAVCGWPTKNYNRIFLSLTRNLRNDGTVPENLTRRLLEQVGQSGEWPSDADFGETWKTRHAYQGLDTPKIVHILRRLSNSYSSANARIAATSARLMDTFPLFTAIPTLEKAAALHDGIVNAIRRDHRSDGLITCS
jgi:hypothetical protein